MHIQLAKVLMRSSARFLYVAKIIPCTHNATEGQLRAKGWGSFVSVINSVGYETILQCALSSGHRGLIKASE